jgi:two-component system LytT family response regulator
MTLRTLIIDDEPLARRRLRQLLQDEPRVDIVGECEDGPSAVAAVRRLEPDLLFLDVQMPGMDGFDVIAELGASACPALIFVTAFDRYAVKAFDVHAVDYLLKPFSRARLSLALDRVGGRTGADLGLARKLTALMADLQASRPLTRFVVKDGERVYFVRVDDVDWLEAAGHYVCLHADGATHVIRDTLSRLESRLDANRFVRVHRSAIVNLDHIKELRAAFHGEYEIVLHTGERLASSRTAGPRIQQLLKHR